MKALSTTGYSVVRWAAVSLVSVLMMSCWFCTADASLNLALNKSVMATSAEGGNVASYAVDGNPGTRWSSDFRDPQWILVDLGSTVAVNRVVLNWEGAYGREYIIQSSSNGIDFTDILHINNGDGGIDDLGLSPVQTRYIRLYGIQRGTPWGYSLWELEVYADDEAPGAPVVNATSGWSNIENEARTISGTVEPNATVIPYVEVFGTAYEQTNVQAGGDGNWSATVNLWGPDGMEFKVFAVARDAAGNWSGQSNGQTIRKDLASPAAPAVGATSAWSNIENEARTITGTAEAGTTVVPYVEIFGAAYEQANVQADGAGNWSAAVNIFGPDGTEFKVYASSRDAAGNWSGKSNEQTIRKDLTPPATPSVAATSEWSNVENEARSIAGTAEAGATVVPYVEVFGAAYEQANVQADGAGNWSAAVNIFGPDGTEFKVYASSRDAAGNWSGKSGEQTVRKDLTAPAMPRLNPTAAWATLENEVRTISGRAEPNATVIPYVAVLGNGTFEQTSVQADAGGAFLAAVNLFGPDGVEFEIYVTAKDAAGNISVQSNSTIVRKDLAAPAAPVVNATSAWSNIENEARTMTGTSEPYAAIIPYVEIPGLGTWEQTNVLADGMGDWSAQVNIWGPDGTQFKVYAIAKDAAGNIGARSNEAAIAKDLVAPVLTIDPVESPTDQDVTLHYTAVDANPVVVTGDASPYTAEGEYTAVLTASDAAGNSSSASVAFVIHRVPPPPVDGTPPVTSFSIDIFRESDRTAISQSLVTLSALDGPAEGATGVAGTEFRFDDGAYSSYAAPFTLEGLSAGPHTLDYRSRDAAGNMESAKRFEFTVADALVVSRHTNQGAAPNLLVWLNYRQGHGSNTGKLFAEGEDVVDQALLDQVLSDIGALSVTKVVSRNDFIKELRSGSYNAYLVLGNRSNSKNAGTYDEELRERVRRGEGVMASFWRSGRLADAKSEGRSVWGAKVGDGKVCKRDLTATFFGGRLVSDTLSIQTDGKTRRVQVSSKDNSPDVTVIGIVDCASDASEDDIEDPDGGDDESGDDDGSCKDEEASIQNQSVAVSNAYFNGRSVYIPFDLGGALSAENAGRIKDLLRAAIGFSRPDVAIVVEGQSATVLLKVTAPVIDLMTLTEVVLPPNIAVTNVSAGGDLNDPGKIKWLMTVSENSTAELSFTVKFPDGDISPAAFTASVSYLVRGTFHPTTTSFIIPVAGGDPAALAAAAASDIATLTVTGSKDNHHKAKAVRELERIKGANLDKPGKLRDALRNWKEAVYSHLLKIESADPAAISAIRDDLTTLMIVLERRFAAGPAGTLARK